MSVGLCLSGLTRPRVAFCVCMAFCGLDVHAACLQHHSDWITLA